ncbi:MAG: hypothetical protein IT210_09475 [Armatimonadetes bacterium]|nr:hypothetical protein [Armatimonadota bacterium]
MSAFTSEERNTVHRLLATHVAYMMGRKVEEADWAGVYCRAKNIPLRGWSNLNIDVAYDNVGLEHKMICYRSHVNLMDACGRILMHPAATRSIRVPLIPDPNTAMYEILGQYADLISKRRDYIQKQSFSEKPIDLRIGWLLWQVSLRQFLYFEEEMLEPDPNDYWAEWRKSGGGVRKESQNLWVYERETGKKRYSITTEAGAKIQPYFDVPPPNDPHIYLFTVIGEVITEGLVRVWVSETTARELEKRLGGLDVKTITEAIYENTDKMLAIQSGPDSQAEVACSLVIAEGAYSYIERADKYQRFPSIRYTSPPCLPFRSVIQ